MFPPRKALVATKEMDDPAPRVIARFELVFSLSMMVYQIVSPPMRVNRVKRARSLAR